MKAQRSKRITFTWILSGLITATGYGQSVQQLRLNEEGKIELGIANSRPPILSITEWQSSVESAPETDEPEQVTVGSAVKTRELSEQILRPKNNAFETVYTDYDAVKNQDMISTVHLGFSDYFIEAEWEHLSDDMTRVKGSVRRSPESTRSIDIPMTLTLAIPMEAGETKFLLSPTKTAATEDTTNQNWTFPTTAGVYGSMSRFPFGGLVSGNTGVGIYHRLDQPRILRVSWNGELQALIAEVDVTLSSLPHKMKNEIPFEFYIGTFDGDLGFRGMARQYLDLFPESFEDRTPTEGNWMPFTQIDNVPRPEDFSFMYHEYHPNISVAYNNANGIDSLVYCEPPVKYIHVNPALPNNQETYEAALKHDSTIVSAVRSSSTKKRDGEDLYTWVVTPWATGARVATNSDFEVPRSSKNPVNAFDYSWQPYIDLYRRFFDSLPADWEGTGTLTDGIISLPGRVAFMEQGQVLTTTARVNSKNPTISVSATGTDGSFLKVSLGEQSQEIELSSRTSDYDLEFQSTPGDQEFRLEAMSGDVAVSNIDSTSLSINNADFSRGQFDNEAVTGLYMDSFEGWDSKDLNFDREQLAFSDYPLTFDATTGQTAQPIMFHNFEFAAEARQRLQDRGNLLMANTALYQWSWSAAWVDVMGIETNWGTGERLTPPHHDELQYIRMLSYQRPYCYLMNVDFSQFRGDKVEGYFRYCLHYGFWPGFFSFNAAENPYWEDPELYEADREYFLRYSEPQRLTTKAGWEPITLASGSSDSILLERWGAGPWRGKNIDASQVFLTALNESERDELVTITLDDGLLRRDQLYAAFDLVTGERLYPTADFKIVFPLGEREAKAIEIFEQTPAQVQKTLKRQQDTLLALIQKWNRHGLLSQEELRVYTSLSQSTNPTELAVSWNRNLPELLDIVGEVYREEANRAISLLLQYCSLSEELNLFANSTPTLPGIASPGDTIEVNFEGSYKDLLLKIGTPLDSSVPLVNGKASFQIPEDTKPDQPLELQIVSAQENDSSLRMARTIHLREPVEAYSIPSELLLREEGVTTIYLSRNSAQASEGELTVSSNDPRIIASVSQVASDSDSFETYDLTFVTSGKGDEFGIDAELTLAFASDERLFQQWQIPVNIVEKNTSLLVTELTNVTTDSTYFGYSTLPLVDGITDVTNVSWAEAAWASEESMVPHWIECTFRKPTTVEEVVIQWSFDAGVHQTSQVVRIEGQIEGSNEWIPLAEHNDPTATSRSTYQFEPTRIQKLRFLQPSGKGPVGRPSIMWITEVEAR